MSRAEQPGPCFRFGVLLFACAVLATAPARAVDRQDQKTLPPPSVVSSPLDPWTQLVDIENARAALANKGVQFQLIYFRDLRLARHHGDQSSERRAHLSAGHTGHQVEDCAKRSTVDSRCRFEWRSGGTGGRRSAAAQSHRHELSRERSAALHRRN